MKSGFLVGKSEWSKNLQKPKPSFDTLSLSFAKNKQANPRQNKKYWKREENIKMSQEILLHFPAIFQPSDIRTLKKLYLFIFIWF